MNELPRRSNVMNLCIVLIMCLLCKATTGAHAVDFLFVQTAAGATLNGTLTLTGIAEDVTYFSDRPVRVAGRMSTEEFMTLFEPGGTFSEVYRYIYALIGHAWYNSHLVSSAFGTEKNRT